MHKKLIVIVVLMVFSLSGCQNEDDLTKVTLMLDYTPNTNHSGLYLAKDLGYYKDAGLDVDIVQPSESATESLVAANKAEFGVSYGENVAQFDDENNQIISILGLVAHNTSGFLSRQEKDITRPKDMENKTYCGWGSDIEQAIIKSVVAADGGNSDLVNITSTTAVDIKNPSSSCDVIWAYAGWDKIDLEQNDIAVNYIPLTDYNLDWYTPVIITSKQYAQEHPEVVSAFVNATIKGYEQAITDPEAASESLLKHAPELDADLVEASQAYLSANYQDEIPFGTQSPEIWNNFIKWLQKNNIVSNNLAVEDLYTNKYIEN